MKLVLIEWLDSKAGPEGWEYLDDLEKIEPSSCRSVGFLVEDNDNHKTIAPTIGGGQVLGRITIPSCSIVNFQVLEEQDNNSRKGERNMPTTPIIHENNSQPPTSQKIDFPIKVSEKMMVNLQIQHPLDDEDLRSFLSTIEALKPGILQRALDKSSEDDKED